MSRSPFSKELEEFVHANIDSVEQMEVLFLLCRERASNLTPQDIATRLYLQPESVTERLADLVAHGLCAIADVSGPCYRYEPENPSKDRLVRELMEAYRTHHVAVITLIFSRPPEHLRLFSDAFKFRKDI